MAEDHYSLSAKVFHSIREDILNGKYQANEELKEKNIGDDLGVSRTPVRSASAAGTGRTGTYHSKQGSVCRRGYPSGYQRYL